MSVTSALSNLSSFGRRSRGDSKPRPEPNEPRFTPEIEAEIEQLVNTPVRFLARSKLTRTFSQTYRWEGRYFSTTHWLLAIAILNLLCALGDPFIVAPARMAPVLTARIWISIIFAAGTLPLKVQRSNFVEGLCIIVPCTFLLLTSGVEGLADGPLLFERYIVNACFVVATGVVFLRIDAVNISILSVVTCLLMMVFVLVSPIAPGMAKAEIMAFHVGAMVALWNAQRIQSLYRYRSVILSLHNEIQARKMSEMNAVLVEVNRTDPLTGIANRRHFDATLADIDPAAQIAIMMIDIDHFKRLNDTFGHSEGDRCLRLVAQAIRSEVRAGDLAARYGGEEFSVLAFAVDLEEVRKMAERIRIAVAALDPGGGNGSTITISVGAAVGMAAAQDAVLKRADQALYEAKDGGRNRVVLAHAAAGLSTPPLHFTAAA